MSQWSGHTEQVQAKVLAAISSLKRATGIPDCQGHPDAFKKDSMSMIAVYTTDHDSAKILSNVISQCVSIARGTTDERKLVREEKRHGMRLAEIIKCEDSGYQVLIDCPPAFTLALADRINERVRSLIAPDTKSGQSL